ncbi:Fur family transcriptional regulator [Aliikangiella coralliicola]|uniref:Transcriptional repressor n=1 Tax=Aliikangiella coralliicola TaxID=2592383 RepID=A0A545UGF8_9GAMM|nr:Fur family transcriptional regulator [Aliikangiella coralliicola]TQV88564.1 transcriptional repressor [Aliikangiella coralliicola]
MATIDYIIKHAEQHCKNNGSRLTDKRKNVLAGLLQSEKALSAYELANYCAKELDQSLPAMSVYRILDFLQEEQLVHKLNLANKYVACSHITCDHAHEVPQFLICSDCQRVTEIGINKKIIQTLQANVEEAGYHLKSPQLEINCICEACVKED